jgi:hypothetical protein
MREGENKKPHPQPLHKREGGIKSLTPNPSPKGRGVITFKGFSSRRCSPRGMPIGITSDGLRD